MIAAGAADLFLFLGSIMEYGIVQRSALTIATQTRIVAFAKTVEIGLCRLALQAAKKLEAADGNVSVVRAATQGLVHRLGVVHLAVANATYLFAEAVMTTVGSLDKLFRWDELDTVIHHIAPRYLFRIGVLAQQLQLGSKRAKGRLHTVSFAQPHRDHFGEQAKKMPNLSCARVTIFGTEIVDVVEIVLALYDWLGIEQGLAVVTLRWARLQFKENSISLTWHSGLMFFHAKLQKEWEITKLFRTFAARNG